MKYTKEQIDAFLGIHNQHQQTETSYAAHGPGHLAGTILFIENNTNAWLQQKKHEATEIKIILSDPFIVNRPLNELEIDFFSSLFEFYPVYFWPNTEVPVTFKEFLKERIKIKSAEEFNVRQQLARTGVQADPLHIKVLDSHQFSKIIAQQKTEYELQNTSEKANYRDYFTYAETDLNLTHINLQKEEEKKSIWNGVNYNLVKTINVRKPNTSELKELLATFPKLTTLQISGADTEWLEKNSALLKGHYVELLDFHVYDKNLNLPDDLNIRKLQIGFIKKNVNTDTVLEIKQKNKSLEKFEIMDKASIDNLVLLLSNFYLEIIDISCVKYLTLSDYTSNHFSRLKKLKIDNLTQEGLLYLEGAHSLESLEVNGNLSLKVVLPKKSYLKVLKLANLNTIEMKKNSLNNLEKLTLADTFLDLELTEAMLPKLKNAVITTAPRVKLLKNIKNENPSIIEEVALYSGNKIINKDQFEEFNFSANSQIKRIHLVGEVYGTIDLSNCSELKNLDIGSSLAKMPLIIWPKQNHIEEVTINNKKMALDVLLQNLTHITSLHYIHTIINLNRDKDQQNLLHDDDVDGVIPFLPNLTSLRLYNKPDSKRLDLQKLPALNSLIIGSNDKLMNVAISRDNVLKNLNITHCYKLINGMGQKSFFDQLTQLECLKIKETPFRRLDLSSLTALKEAHIDFIGESGVPLGEVIIDLKNNKSIKKLVIDITRNSVDLIDDTVIDLTHCENLSEIEINVNGPVILKGLSTCHNLRFAKIQAENYPVDALRLTNLDLKYVKTHPPFSQNKEEMDALSTANQNSNSSLQDTEQNEDEMYMQLQDLHFQNERSATSCLSLTSGRCKPDGKTAKDLTPRSFENAPLRATLLTDDGLSKDNNRFEVFDTVEWDEATNDIVFVSNINEKEMEKLPADVSEEKEMLANYMQAKEENPYLSIGNLKGKMDAGRWYPLLTRQPPENKDAIKISSDHPHLEFFWYEPHRQYYCKLNAAAKATENVNIFYSLPKNVAYEDKKFSHQYCAYTEDHLDKLLPKQARDGLEQFFEIEIKTNEKLAFINDGALSIADKLEKLKAYCKFEEAVNLDEEPNNTFELLLQIIHERKGACRHRAWAFMLLARYIGVPANNIINEMHSFCEIPYISEANKKIELQRIDLDGAPVIDKTPLEARQNPFEEFAKENDRKFDLSTSNNNNLTESKSTQIENQEDLKFYRAYCRHFDSLRNEVSIHDIDPLLTTQKKAPVIELTAEQNSWEVSQEIRQQLIALNPSFNPKTDYFYIDNPKDFYAFLESYRLANGTRSEKPIPGPLLDFLNNPNGILVINWSNFSPNDIANFKSVIDKDPTLLSYLSKIKKVIGLIKANTIVSEDFSSRTRRLVLANDFFKHRPEHVKQNAAKKQLEIDLYHQADWREFLLGKVDIDEHDVHFRPSTLLTSIEKNESVEVTVCNIPEDADCKRILNHLHQEKKLFYNGVNYDVSVDITIKFATKKHDMELPIHVKLQCATIENLPSPSEAKYCNSSNWHEFFETMEINNKNNTAKLFHQGDLAAKESDVRFVITESMTKANWNYLLSHINTLHEDPNHKNKQFHFILAPGISIEGVMENREENTVVKSILIDEIEKSAVPVYLSNDPDFTAFKINEKYPDAVLIDASADADFSNLIASITQKRTEKGYDFNYNPHAILTALQKGKRVILNADLSESAYQQLLPFLKTPTKIKINNEMVNLTGELILVLPQKTASHFHLLTPSAECEVTWKDYYKAFPNDASTLDKLKSFYKLAERFPHRGAGRPTQPRLSYYRLKKLIRAATSKSILRGNNPLKNHFHYDYPKNSNDYAYLNVIAKWHLSTNEKMHLNKRKWNQYVDQFGGFSPTIFKENSWYFLNCCNGPLLKEILGSNLSDVITDAPNEMPKVSEKVVDRIYQYINKFQQTETVKDSQSRTYKLDTAFNEFLKNDDLSVFFLKGDPGVGKTHSTKLVTKLPGVNLIKGKDALIRWLTTELSSTDEYPVLFWDEINEADPGTLDFLKAIDKAKKENSTDDQGNIQVFYQGKLYSITPRHKIFATGNFEYTPHRHYQTFLQDFAYTFYLPKPNEAELIEKVLAPQLQHFFPTENNHYQQSERFLLDVYHNLPRFNPYLLLSLRDMHNVVSRFKTLWQENKNADYGSAVEQSVKRILFAAASGEFAATIPENDKRQHFLNYLRTKLSLEDYREKRDELIELTDGIMIPSEKEYLIKAVEQDLLIQNNSKNIPNQNYKQAILLEGESGIGKSTILEGLLKKNGYSLNAEDPLKRYYIVSGGDKNAYDILKKAAREGSKIILNELNLFDERVNKLLLHLLNIHDKEKTKDDGKTEEDIVLHPDTFILASQNPSYFPGRNTVDAPIMNRVHLLYMDSYSDTELEKFASFYKIENPKAFVQAYKKANEAAPTIINMRTFFEELHHLSKSPFNIPIEVIETVIEEENPRVKKSKHVITNTIVSQDNSIDTPEILSFIDKVTRELEANTKVVKYIGKGFLFFYDKTPTHINELNKKLKRIKSIDHPDTKFQIAVDLVKILISAKDNHTIFRTKATSQFYNASLEVGLKAVNLTEDQFRKKYKIEHPHIFEARFLKHRRNF